MADLVRVLRLIEYAGEREWVEGQVRNSIHGTKVLPKGVITAVTLTEFPEKLEEIRQAAIVTMTSMEDEIQQLLEANRRGSTNPNT